MQLKRNETLDTYSNLKANLKAHLDSFADGEMVLLRDSDYKSYIGVKNNNDSSVHIFDVSKTPIQVSYEG